MSETLLIIEDDPQIRKVVESYLRQAGYRVLSAADGPAGLALAQQEKPMVLVLDLMLPGIDMAKAAQTKAEHLELKTLAANIIKAQETERAQMKTWQETWLN